MNLFRQVRGAAIGGGAALRSEQEESCNYKRDFFLSETQQQDFM